MKLPESPKENLGQNNILEPPRSMEEEKDIDKSETN